VDETGGDRDPRLHLANLLDLDAKYADVISLEEARAALRTAPEQASGEPRRPARSVDGSG
jgi:hypothetical protein